MYVDSISCDAVKMGRKRPLICTWDLERLRKREDIEIIEGGFGRGHLLGDYIEVEEVINQKVEV